MRLHFPTMVFFGNSITGAIWFSRTSEKATDGKKLRIEDGWTYFIHGWTQVIAEVFHHTIPTSGPQFDALAAIAASMR